MSASCSMTALKYYRPRKVGQFLMAYNRFQSDDIVDRQYRRVLSVVCHGFNRTGDTYDLLLLRTTEAVQYNISDDRSPYSPQTNLSVKYRFPSSMDDHYITMHMFKTFDQISDGQYD